MQYLYELYLLSVGIHLYNYFILFACLFFCHVGTLRVICIIVKPIKIHHFYHTTIYYFTKNGF